MAKARGAWGVIEGRPHHHYRPGRECKDRLIFKLMFQRSLYLCPAWCVPGREGKKEVGEEQEEEEEKGGSTTTTMTMMTASINNRQT